MTIESVRTPKYKVGDVVVIISSSFQSHYDTKGIVEEVPTSVATVGDFMYIVACGDGEHLPLYEFEVYKI